MDAPGDNALDLAAHRLERAVAGLEQRLGEKLTKAGQAVDGLFDRDRAKLAEQLDAARAREKALESAGAEASAALKQAIAEMRVVLGEEA